MKKYDIQQSATALFSVKGKIALITGSGGGLGFEIARGLGHAGATVILNGRNEIKLERAAKQLEQVGIDVYYKKFDVTEEEGVELAIRDIEQKHDGIDVLVNNAGITYRGELQSLATADFSDVMKTNLVAPFLVSKHAVKGMIKRKSGKIINICSITSELARQTNAAYSAAKGGLKMLTKSMAIDWAQHNIQVNGIGPGYFKTELTQVLADNEEFDAWLKKRTPAGRWGDPAELIGAALFLASDASSFVNGQIIYVDGGLLASV